MRVTQNYVLDVLVVKFSMCSLVPRPHGSLGMRLFNMLMQFLPSSCLLHSGLDTDKLAEDTYMFFGPGTEYEEARHQRSGPGLLQLALMFLRHNPVNGPWTNHCLKTFISNRAAGRTPEADGRTVDPDGLVKVREGLREGETVLEWKGE